MIWKIAGHPLGAWTRRGAAYLAFWVILIGVDPLDLVVGVFTAVAAAWTSLRLAPPGAQRLRLAGLPRLALRFLWQSIVAGADVARRAFDPRLPLATGFVLHATRYPRGAQRNAFASLTSLLPGTVPVRDDAHGLLYHCLDTLQPIAQQLAEEETAVSRVLPQSTQP